MHNKFKLLVLKNLVLLGLLFLAGSGAVWSVYAQQTSTAPEALFELYDQAGKRYREYYLKQQEYFQSSTSENSTALESRKDSWEDFQKQQRQAYKSFVKNDNDKLEQFVTAENEAWKKYVKEVEAKWGRFQGSTQYEWVEYNPDRDSRSYVDFRLGILVVEVVIPKDSGATYTSATKLLQNQIDEILAEPDMKGSSILSGQLPPSVNLKENALSPFERGTIIGEDGVRRIRYAIATDLVDDHLLRRATKYMPIVQNYCVEYNLDQSLVLSIIETESAFNPRALSWADAVGLMQIVPQYAGKETWFEIYETDNIPDHEYLYNPDNNIRHGCCYLSLLREKYWKDVENGAKKDYIIICSYNAGPNNVDRLVFRRFGTADKHNDKEMLNLLLRYMPKETQNYLTQVVNNRSKWSQAIAASESHNKQK